MTQIISSIREKLRQMADKKLEISGQRFFKESVKMYGTKTAQITKLGNEYYQTIKGKPKAEIFQLCDELWQSGYIEETFIACNWSYKMRRQYQPEDILIFERWISSYITNWASCDTFCNHSVGSFIEMYPIYLIQLKKWAKSGNLWMRRASAVSLIVPARRGLFLYEILEIANILLNDSEDLVQKGYGWMLKAASETHQKEIYNYVIERKNIMPRTALRYAIEKMPQKLRVEAMKK